MWIWIKHDEVSGHIKINHFQTWNHPKLRVAGFVHQWCGWGINALEAPQGRWLQILTKNHLEVRHVIKPGGVFKIRHITGSIWREFHQAMVKKTRKRNWKEQQQSPSKQNDPAESDWLETKKHIWQFKTCFFLGPTTHKHHPEPKAPSAHTAVTKVAASSSSKATWWSQKITGNHDIHDYYPRMQVVFPSTDSGKNLLWMIHFVSVGVYPPIHCDERPNDPWSTGTGWDRCAL